MLDFFKCCNITRESLINCLVVMCDGIGENMKYCVVGGSLIIASAILIAADAINMSGQSHVLGVNLQIFALIVFLFGVLLCLLGLIKKNSNI